MATWKLGPVNNYFPLSILHTDAQMLRCSESGSWQGELSTEESSVLRTTLASGPEAKGPILLFSSVLL